VTVKYRIYIDETGNADLGSSDNPNHRFLSLTGVIIALPHVDAVIHPEMEALKREFFDHHADDPVVFHRKDMVNRLGRFEVLKSPELEQAFNARLLECLRKWDYSIITVLMDKREHRDKYQTWKFDPYHYCLAILLERYLFSLERQNAAGDVMIESRGKGDNQRLAESYRTLMGTGSDFVEVGRFQKRITSGEIKIRPKHFNISGLQLADMLAHPSRRDILARLNLLDEEQGRPRPFGDQIVAVLAEKYERYKNEIMGSGLKKLP